MLTLRHAPLALLTTLALGCGSTPVEEPIGDPLPTLESLLVEQTELYPLMTEADLYKLVSQATRGPAIPFIGRQSGLDPGLEKEVRQMKVPPAPGEPDVEVLDPARDLVRVNLRPYLKAGGKLSDLARAVGETHRVFRGDRAMFLGSLERAAELLEDERLIVAFDAAAFEQHVKTMRGKGFPPGVHSSAYAKTYAPAYRIIQRYTLSDRDYGGRDEVR